MPQYRVQAKPWFRRGKTKGYELHITGPEGEHVGVTQSHGLQDAVMMAKDYISLQTETPVEFVGVTFTINLHTAGPEPTDAEH